MGRRVGTLRDANRPTGPKRPIDEVHSSVVRRVDRGIQLICQRFGISWCCFLCRVPCTAVQFSKPVCIQSIQRAWCLTIGINEIGNTSYFAVLTIGYFNAVRAFGALWLVPGKTVINETPVSWLSCYARNYLVPGVAGNRQILTWYRTAAAVSRKKKRLLWREASIHTPHHVQQNFSLNVSAIHQHLSPPHQICFPNRSFTDKIIHLWPVGVIIHTMFQTIQHSGQSSIWWSTVFILSPVWVARLEPFCLDIIWFVDWIHTSFLSTVPPIRLLVAPQRHQNSQKNHDTNLQKSTQQSNKLGSDL